ncbi:YveK family protein [Metaplanococcus flavidus]|uniref:YveK family protein n=1 Tax=Metaplanococcus flavidus TaxID=569883 RepID=A0ABW3LAX4_9BACL
MAEKVMIFNILKSLKNHLKLIAGIALVSIIIIWSLVTFIIAPQYEANSQILIEQTSGEPLSPNHLEIQKDPQVVNAYIAMIKSRGVLTSAIQATGSTLTTAELYEKVSVTNVSDSQVLNITVTDKNRMMAGELANALANIAVAEAWDLMKINNLNIISKASVEEVPSFLEENTLYVMAIGGLFGSIVGILLAFISELFNMLFRTGVLVRRRKQSNFQTVFK